MKIRQNKIIDRYTAEINGDGKGLKPTLTHQKPCQFFIREAIIENDMPTIPEFIHQYIAADWNPKYVDKITQDMIDVAAGNRQGNQFEKEYIEIIMAAYETQKSATLEKA